MLNYSGEWSSLMASCDEVGRILNGLITSLLAGS